MQLVKAPLKTIYNGKPEQLQMHIQEFTRRMQNTGLYQEFQIRTTENARPDKIPINEWVEDYPLRWQTINFLDNFGAATFDTMLRRENKSTRLDHAQRSSTKCK